jgi:hypothetical protein
MQGASFEQRGQWFGEPAPLREESPIGNQQFRMHNTVLLR